MENKYCETCVFNVEGRCMCSKINEGLIRFSVEEGEDMLIYTYAEGGDFWVGPKFGCVHHKDCKTSALAGD